MSGRDDLIYVSNEEQQEVQKHQLQSKLGMWTIQHRGQSGRNQWQGTNDSERGTDSQEALGCISAFALREMKSY